MKVLVSADWHIKLGTKNIPDAWAVNRYRILFAELHKLEQSVDRHLILGDVFDRLPKMEELELFLDYVIGCRVKTIIIPGNHEALKRNTTFLTHLKSTVTKLNPLVRIIDEYHSEDGIDYIPYNRLKEYRPDDIDFHNNILCTHVRGEIPPHVKPEINLELFSRWDVVLAGDLHSYENSQLNILYPGSPVSTSFHRSHVDTGVIYFDTETLEHSWVKLEVPQLIRKTLKAGDEAVATPYHHTIYEVEGNLAELSSLEDNELVEKKVTKRTTDTALILDSEMSIETELSEYLTYILELGEAEVQEVLMEYANHANKI